MTHAPLAEVTVTMLRSPVGRCPHAQPGKGNNTSRCNKVSRSSRVKVVKVQGRRGSRSTRFKVDEVQGRRGSRSTRFKVVEVQGRRGSRSTRFKVVEVQGRRGSRSSRFKVVEVQGSSMLRAYSRCRPTERVRSSRCIHETQSESAEELRRAPPSFLIAFLCFSTLERSSNFHHPRQSSPARVPEVRHVIGCSRDLCRRDGRGRRDSDLERRRPLIL